MKITKRQLRRIIKEEKAKLLKENPEGLSNSDFAKGLKTGAGDLAASIPTALNADFADAMKKLAAMAKFDKSKFEKVKGLIDANATTAMEKSSAAGDSPAVGGEGVAEARVAKILSNILREQK